jgi:excisionase family DNA binding protein
MTITETAEFLKCPRHYVNSLLLRGELKASAESRGRDIRIARSALEAYLRSHPGDQPGRKRSDAESAVHH